MAITYDGTNILNNIQITRLVQHESVANYDIDSFNASRLDGTIYIDEFLREKQILIEGVINGTTQANLEANIDTFNELMNRKNKNLDISYAGGTRRYVCVPQSTTYNRDHFNLNFVPFKVIMLVPAGVGTDTSVTTLTAKTLTAVTTTDALTFLGSAGAKPIFKLLVNTVGNGDVVKIENTDNGDYIEVELKGFSATNYAEVDCENLTVLKNGTTPLIWNGKFPRINSGVNNIKYTVIGSGSTLDQKQESGGRISSIYVSGGYTPQTFQSFIPSISGSIGKLSFNWGISAPSAGTEPTGKITYIVYDDDNGKPGNVVGSSLQYNLSDFSVSGGWKDIDLQQKTFVTKNKKYWITAEIYNLVGSDATHYVYFNYSNDASSYLYGKAIARKVSTDSFSDGVADSPESGYIKLGQFDLGFKVYMGYGASPTFNITAQAKYTKKYL
jgi:hypothetical protein